jgi:histidine triad (HIT) family protein
MASIFTRIINGELPCHKVAETNDYLAFLDIRPLTFGHTLVIPKQEVDYVFDLDDETYVGLQVFAKLVAKALKKVTGQRVGVCVIGLEVPHAHIHLIPFTQMEQMNFSNPKLSLTQEELSSLARKIQTEILGTL